MNGVMLGSFVEQLELENIAFEADDTTASMSDASFLSLGRPGLVVFPKSEDEVLKVVGFAARNSIPLTPRAKGSSTAGAASTSPARIHRPIA